MQGARWMEEHLHGKKLLQNVRTLCTVENKISAEEISF